MEKSLKEAVADFVRDSHSSMGELARQIGMSRSTLYDKLDDPGSFRVSEINKLCAVIGYDLDPFFGTEVTA